MAIASSDSNKTKDNSYFHKGKISDCILSGCYGKCCEFTRAGYAIVLHPGELQDAHDSGLSTDHLRIVDDNFHGGQLAVCIAHDKINCDHGYKPHDCIYYPFFPVPDNANGTIRLVADRQCKLIAHEGDLSAHIQKTTKLVHSLIERDPAMVTFLANAAPKDYFPYRPNVRTATPAQQLACALGDK